MNCIQAHRKSGAVTQLWVSFLQDMVQSNSLKQTESFSVCMSGLGVNRHYDLILLRIRFLIEVQWKHWVKSWLYFLWSAWKAFVSTTLKAFPPSIPFAKTDLYPFTHLKLSNPLVHETFSKELQFCKMLKEST